MKGHITAGANLCDIVGNRFLALVAHKRVTSYGGDWVGFRTSKRDTLGSGLEGWVNINVPTWIAVYSERKEVSLCVVSRFGNGGAREMSYTVLSAVMRYT